MPPTALTLRFFSLPQTSIIWLNQLMELRNVIHKKKEIISKVIFGKKEIETDGVKNNLNKLIEQHTLIEHIFRSENTKINIVLNNDQLSVFESIRINIKLKEIGLNTAHFILNKTSKRDYTEQTNQLPQKPSIQIPENNGLLSGLDKLNSFIQKKVISDSLSKLY